MVESASDRMLRIVSVAYGIGSAIFTLIGLGEIIAAHGRFIGAYSVGAEVLYLGIPILVGALAYFSRTLVLRVLLLAHSIITVLVFVLWTPSAMPGTLPTDTVPWINNIFAIACCGLALIAPFSVSIAYTIAISVLSGLVRWLTYGGGDPGAAVQDALYGVLFTATLVTLLQLSKRAADLQDEVSATNEAEATRSRAAAMLERQRGRYQAFVRDEVRGVLQQALLTGTVSETTQDAARRALARLDAMGQGPPVDAVLDVAELRSLLEEAGGGRIALGLSTSGSVGDLRIPREVADGIASAFGEAVRNSVRHAAAKAGDPVLRRAWITASPEHLEVAVTDDGVGFSPARIPFDRMGVRAGILATVQALPGAAVEIDSSRGRGTTVRMTWHPVRAHGAHAQERP